MKKKPKTPFFIIGCNRSGTSLLRTMLNHHPKIAVPPESVFFIDYIQTKKDISINTQKLFVLYEPGVKEWGIKLKKTNLNNASSTKDIFTIVHEKYAAKNGKKFWGNKTPRFTTECESITKMFPEAVFIHIVRDPRAVVLSLKNDHLIRSNVYYGSKRWVNYVGTALKFEQKFRKDTHRIYYEELVTNPRKVLRGVCKFLNVNYSEKMMNYCKTGSSEYLAFHKKLHKNLSKAPFAKRINHWEKILSKREVEIIENSSFELMKKFGYKPLYSRSKIRLHEYIYYSIERVFGFIMQVFSYALPWPRYFVYTVVRKIVFGTLFSEAKKLNY